MMSRVVRKEKKTIYNIKIKIFRIFYSIKLFRKKWNFLSLFVKMASAPVPLVSGGECVRHDGRTWLVTAIRNVVGWNQYHLLDLDTGLSVVRARFKLETMPFIDVVTDGEWRWRGRPILKAMEREVRLIRQNGQPRSFEVRPPFWPKRSHCLVTVH